MDCRQIMMAMVLSAGYGTRLGELTKEIPKPMLLVNGKPMLEYILLHLKHHGVIEIIINLHFMPDLITSYFGNGSRLGLHIHYSFEDTLLGTAGGLKKVERLFKDKGPFLVHYGDILTNQDFSEMLQFHGEKKAVITMLVHQRRHSNSVVQFDESHRINRFLERPSDKERAHITSSWVNSGICICEQAVFNLIPSESSQDLPRDIFAKHHKEIPIFAFPLNGFRCAVDSPDRLKQANEAFKTGLLQQYEDILSTPLIKSI